MTNMGDVDPDDLAAKYVEMTDARNEILAEAADVAMAARRLGVSAATVFGTLKQAGFSEEVANEIMYGGASEGRLQGKFTPWEPSDQSADSFRARMLSAGRTEEQADSILRARGSAVTKARKNYMARALRGPR